MNEETIKKYKEYDFSKDNRWQDYLQAIYPMPPMDKLTKMKKKWYKTYVDQQFDPEADLDAPAPQPQAQHNHGQAGGQAYTNQGQQEASLRPFGANKLYHVEGLLKVVFIVGSFIVQFLPFMHLYLMLACAVTCLLGLYRQHGRPRFNQEYLGEFMSNEFGMALFYLLSVCSMPSRGPFIYLPLLMQFVLGVADFEPRTNYVFLKFSKVQGFLQAVSQMKHEVRVGKAYAEFFNLFYFLVLIALGKMSILFIIIYLQFVKFKYKMNQTSNLMVNNCKNWLKEKVARVPAISAVLGKAVDGLFWVVTY
jgi:hypothetical protein